MYSRHYISTGDQTKMYTLRHQFEEKVSFLGEGGVAESAVVMRDWHIQNLSNNSEQAIKRAGELGFKVQKPKFTLEEIIRRDSETVQAAREAAEERFLTTQKMKLDHELQLVKDHCFPFGRNEGRTFEWMISDKGDDWAGYWMNYGRQESANATVQFMGKVLESLYPEIARITFLSDSGNGKYFGKIGVRQKKIKVTNVASYGFDGFYGYTYIEKFLTESGELLMYMGSACIDCRKGDELVISFGIKLHETYEGEHQTKIQRVKVHD